MLSFYKYWASNQNITNNNTSITSQIIVKNLFEEKILFNDQCLELPKATISQGGN
jgi:hypothetical protein